MVPSKKLMGLKDARSSMGRMARGNAIYGLSNSPKPGNLNNIQKAARKRIKRLHDQRRFR